MTRENEGAAFDGLVEEAISAHLKTAQLGRTLHLHEELDSTNDEAHRLAERGAPHGTVILAEAQTKGRGRRGRAWSTPKGKSLAMSILLRPQIPAARAPELSFAAAIAVCETARELGAASAKLKWPNDVQCRGRKLSGLLAEMRAQSGELSHVVIGIGLNVNVSREDLPTELQELATSLLLEAGKPISRALACAVLLNSLEPWLSLHAREGFSPLRTRWRELSSTLGQRVRVEGTTPIIGTAEDLADNGALLIRSDDGDLRRVVAGDVEHLRAI